MGISRKENLTTSSSLYHLPGTENAQRRDVEVTVYDKHIDSMQVFRCDLALLQATMAYFAPIIQRYMEEERQKQKSSSLPSVSAQAQTASDLKHALPPVPLRVNCEIKIFAWLMDYVEGRQRVLTPDNAVSIALSSNFLFMKPLVDTSLRYIKDHLVQVMLSGVNMSCLTGDLIARLSSIVSDADLARAFLNFFHLRSENSPNRRFLTALLRHVVCDRLLERCNTSLSWCHLCGVLFDREDLLRAERNGRNVKPALCPKLSPNCIGIRGEVLKSHVASSHFVDLDIPSISSSDKCVECWAWRVIGAIYYYQCLRCGHLVFLVDAVAHGCPGGVSSLAPLDSISRADADALLAWFRTARALYDGGVAPLRLDRADQPRRRVLMLSPSGEWTGGPGGPGGAGETPGLWAARPAAVEESVNAAGRVNVDAQNRAERSLMAELQLAVGGRGRPAPPVNRPISPACAPRVSAGVEGRMSRATQLMQAQRKEKLFVGSAMQRGRSARLLPEHAKIRTVSPTPHLTQSIPFTRHATKLSMSSLLRLGAELRGRDAAITQQEEQPKVQC